MSTSIDPTHRVELDVTDDGRVATLTFTSDHPANVMTRAMLDDLVTQIARAERAEGLRVLVLRGRDDIFSGGADLELMRALGDEEYRDYIATEYALFRRLERLPLITVAAISGACIGNAAELALACDFRVLTAGSRIGLPELKVGFVAPAQRLSQYVGIGVAKELLYGGRLLDAEEGRRLGLVTTVAEGALDEELERLVRRWAAVAPVALPLAKAGLERCYAPDDHDAEELEAAFTTFKSEDFSEGADAVLEGRRPHFAGR